MTPEILAKIMGIIAKTGERVIVIDPKTGNPFVLLNLEEYEKIAIRSAGGWVGVGQTPSHQHLTASQGSGMIDPDLALIKEVARGGVDWGGHDKEEEEDKYYLEPTE